MHMCTSLLENYLSQGFDSLYRPERDPPAALTNLKPEIVILSIWRLPKLAASIEPPDPPVACAMRAFI